MKQMKLELFMHIPLKLITNSLLLIYQTSFYFIECINEEGKLPYMRESWVQNGTIKKLGETVCSLF
jgi:hypothetical protein